MSKESAESFVERMKSDDEFAAKIREFQNMDDVEEFIKNSGYDFTQEELNSLSDELTDDDLDQISSGKQGGGSCPGAGSSYYCKESRGVYAG